MAVPIFWVSPLPPVRSGVSDYAVEILRPLSALTEVRILTPPDSQGEPHLPPDLARLLVPHETVADSEEVIVTHFGNNPYHQWIFDWCRDRRTVAVVHDTVLHHLLVHDTLDVGRGPEAFEAAMGVAHGQAGTALASAREFGLTGRLDPFLFPALKAVLGQAKAMICHSNFARILLEKDFPGQRVLQMGLPAADPGPLDRAEIRKTLGVSESEILMMHLGFLTPEKGMNSILAGLAAARSCGVDARLLLVGEDGGGTELKKVAGSLGICDAVASTGWLEWNEMISVPAAADVGVVLRVPSAGETSAAVVRFLACGTPAAVIAQRQFLEWPSSAAPRITPGPSMAAEIARLLRQVSKARAWEDRRSAARRSYEDLHTTDKAARTMVEFLRRLKTE